MLFIGDDWAEAHHDIEIANEEGKRLARRRLPEGVAGGRGLATVWSVTTSERLRNPDQVLVGIETDRGPWVKAVIACYSVYAINPIQVARYREGHGIGRAKSDPGDAHRPGRCGRGLRRERVRAGGSGHRDSHPDRSARGAGERGFWSSPGR